MEKRLFYREIPKVDSFLETEEIKELIRLYGREPVTRAVREEEALLRDFIFSSSREEEIKEKIRNFGQAVGQRVQAVFSPDLRRVINATGIILHTNLGRAPIGEMAADHLRDVITGYCNLEYNLMEGRRGERYSHFEALLCSLTGAEAAMAVNNNAAAVMLVLSSLARGGDVVVSRGELVEIGGKFRVPEVISMSGAHLVETGTTNKTHLSDYEKAVSEQTKAFLKVHTSNYRIVGFSELVDAGQIRELAERLDIPVVEDLGSGSFVDLRPFGCEYEPTVQEEIKKGVDLVCFSGDKLLGGPQAGIIAGRRKYIDLIKKNPLTRALRIDKFTAAVLEQTLLEYQAPGRASSRLPVLRMIEESRESIKKRAQRLADLLAPAGAFARIECCPSQSQIGGGAMPLTDLKSMAVTIKPSNMSAAGFERELRALPVPVIGRIKDDRIWLDVRTMGDEDINEAAEQINDLLARTGDRP